MPAKILDQQIFGKKMTPLILGFFFHFSIFLIQFENFELEQTGTAPVQTGYRGIRTGCHWFF
jgi:hypothetical protein